MFGPQMVVHGWFPAFSRVNVFQPPHFCIFNRSYSRRALSRLRMEEREKGERECVGGMMKYEAIQGVS